MPRRLTRDEVVTQFRSKHGDFYDYSKFVYVSSRTKGIIICPNHGEFEQSPHNHKSGCGCPRCKAEHNSKTKTLSKDEVIAQFRYHHGNFYDYSEFIYGGNQVKGIIICPNHGEFEQTPNNHRDGHGCPRCSGNQPLSQDEVISRFRSKHGNFYDYSKFVYVSSRVKGIIICPNHGEFEQNPTNHRDGQGCPTCAKHRTKGGYDTLTTEKRTRILDVHLYHLELEYEGTIFHKVGITGDPPQRFNVIQRDSGAIIVNGWTHMYKNAENAFKCEQRVLDYMMIERAERYYHPLNFAGETECFTPVPNPNGWNLDLNNIPKRSERFNFNE